MAAIDQYLRQILEATYGEEVRHSIHDAIKQNYMDISDSVEQANAAVDAAEDAVADANRAVDQVNAVIDAANEASATANAASSTATDASQRATSAADLVEGVEQDYENATATVTSLSEDANPTATLTDGPNGKIFAFGIPKGKTGAKGDTGATPNLSIGTVAKGDSAAATITGTAENPVLNLTLPKGDTGAAGAQGQKGDTGATPQIGIGTVSTGAAGSNAEVTISGSADAPQLNFKIPKGDTGATPTVYGNTVPMSSSDSTTVAQAIANATDADAVHIINGKSATNHVMTVNADDIKMSADDTTNIPNKLKQYVKTVNGTAPDPITGNVTVATGGGDSTVGLIRRVIGIPVSEWAGNGPYTYTYQDADIKVGMVVLEDTLSDEYAQLGINTYTVQNGSLTIATTVKPTADWSLDVALGMDGSSILDDVGDLQTKVGTSTLTTTAQNLSDAVNELDDELSDQSQQIDELDEEKAEKNNLTAIIRTGATNTGDAITKGSYFYLNDILVKAITGIPNSATFTSGTNYETIPNGVLNDISDSGWILLNSTNQVYYRKIGNMVAVRGLTVVSTTWSELGTLPQGYRPKTSIYRGIIDRYNDPVDDRSSMCILTDGIIYSSGNTSVRFQETFLLN